MALEGINRTVWGTKLLLTAVLASIVDSTSLCHTEGIGLLLGALTHLGLPTRPHLSPNPLSAHPPPIVSIRDIIGTEENYLKNQQYSSSL